MVLTADGQKRIGLLGGTFDPVHNGHLAVAEFVLAELGLDSILFIPAAVPPHKECHAGGREISSFDHRYAMVQLAIAQNSSFAVSDLEAKRSTPSYSIDTINILRQKTGERSELFFIIGVDAFLEIDTWKQFQQLPDLVNFVVISRPGYPPDRVGETISRNFGGYSYDQDTETWRSNQNKGLFILKHMEPVPISSTQIREKTRTGKDISDLVSGTVVDYINTHRLYSK